MPPMGQRGEWGLPGAPAQREAVSQARLQHPHPHPQAGPDPAQRPPRPAPLGPTWWGPRQPGRAVRWEAPRLLLILRKIANPARSFRCTIPHSASLMVCEGTEPGPGRPAGGRGALPTHSPVHPAAGARRASRLGHGQGRRGSPECRSAPAGRLSTLVPGGWLSCRPTGHAVRPGRGVRAGGGPGHPPGSTPASPMEP